MSVPRTEDELLAEFWKIRQEYNSLDKKNPNHANRRAELKARYRQLDRRYGLLIAQGEARQTSEVFTRLGLPPTPPVRKSQSDAPDKHRPVPRTKVDETSFGFAQDITPVPEKPLELSGSDDGFESDSLQLDRIDVPLVEAGDDNESEFDSGDLLPMSNDDAAGDEEGFGLDSVAVPKSDVDPSLRGVYHAPDTPPEIADRMSDDFKLVQSGAAFDPVDGKPGWSDEYPPSEERFSANAKGASDASIAARQELERSLAALKADHEKVQAALARSEQHVRELETRLEERQASEADLQAERDENAGKLAAAEERIDRLSEELDEVRRDSEALAQDRDADEGEHQRSQDDLARMRDQLQATEAEKSEFEDRLAATGAELSDLKAKLAAAEGTDAASHQQIEDLDAQVSRLLGDLSRSQKELDRLTQVELELTKTRNGLRQELDKTRAELDRMREADEDHTSHVGKLESERDALHAETESLQRELGVRDDTLVVMERRMSDLIKASQEAERAIQSLTNDLDKSRIRADELEQQVRRSKEREKDLLQRVDQSKETSSLLQAKHAESDQHHRELTAKLRTVEAELDQKANAVSEILWDQIRYREREAALTEQLSAARAAVDDLELAASRVEDENTSGGHAQVKLTKELRKKDRELARVTEELTVIREREAHLNERLEASLDQLAELKRVRREEAESRDAAADVEREASDAAPQVAAQEELDGVPGDYEKSLLAAIRQVKQEGITPPDPTLAAKAIQLMTVPRSAQPHPSEGALDETIAVAPEDSDSRAVEQKRPESDSSYSRSARLLIFGAIALLSGLFFIAAFGFGWTVSTGDGGVPVGFPAALVGIVFTLAGTLAIGFGLLQVTRQRGEAVHEMAREGRLRDLESWLDTHRSDLDAVDDQGFTLLHSAVTEDQLDAVKLLVARGADLEARTPAGETPLHIAASTGSLACARFLIEKGADVRTENNRGSTLLHVAAWAGDVDALEFFFSFGLDVNAQGRTGFTPLHFAAQAGHIELIQRLLNAGADTNAGGEIRMTPLEAAVRARRVDAVRVLLESGARGQDGSNTGLVEFARASGQAEIALMLEESHQKPEMASR